MLAWGVGARLLGVILCWPSDGGWGAVSAWGSLGAVVWTRLCFGWFALSCVREDFCVSVRGFLVWA